jgi:molecular chaperone DnaK (HSP70)
VEEESKQKQPLEIGKLNLNKSRYVGGIDFENEVLRLCVAKIKKDFSVDVSTNQIIMLRLKLEVNNCIKELDNNEFYIIKAEKLIDEKDFEWKFTRQVFEKANIKKFEECMYPVQDVLKETNTSKESVDEIILVGGASKIPMIKTLLQKEFEGKEINCDLKDESVIMGCIIQAHSLGGSFEKKVPDKTKEKTEKEEEMKRKELEELKKQEKEEEDLLIKIKLQKEEEEKEEEKKKELEKKEEKKK